jgi:hypothetical protein
MSDYLSSVLEELVPRFDDEDGNWGRVVADAGAEAPATTARARTVDATAARRRRRGGWRDRWLTRRRLVVIALAGLLAALLSTPALGIGGRVLDLVQGTPAPPEVQTFFATSDAYPDAARDPDEVGTALHDLGAVIASEARLAFAIETPDGPIHIWTAPTKDGQQCTLYQWGDPLPNGQLPLTNIAWGGQGEAPLKDEPVNGMAACEFDPGASGLMPVGVPLESVSLVRVWFHDPTITQIEVERQDAPPVSLPVVAVGKGFMAAGTIPSPTAGHEHASWSSTAVVARSADGTEMAREYPWP